MFIFNFLNKNSIGKAIAYATASRLHLSVHSTALLSCCQAGQPRKIMFLLEKPISSAECLMHGAKHASQRTLTPHPLASLSMRTLLHSASGHLLWRDKCG